MAVSVLLEVQAKQGTGDELLSTFKALLPDARARAGCLDLAVHQNQSDRDNIVLVERWATKDEYESYMGWRQDTGVLDQLVAACEGPPTIRYFDITDA